MADQCTAFVLPIAKHDFCAPEINFGRIDKIYFASDGASSAFTDFSDLAEWTARLDNVDVADVTKIRFLGVIGNKPLPENTEISYSLGRTTFTTNKHTLAVRVDETHDDNYALVKWLEANKGQVLRVWYASAKYLYGGNEGILATLSLNDFIPEGDTELNEFQGSVLWEGDTPDRTLNILS